nr:hypothetical protein [Deinococcus alpinitundrae]
MTAPRTDQVTALQGQGNLVSGVARTDNQHPCAPERQAAAAARTVQHRAREPLQTGPFGQDRRGCVACGQHQMPGVVLAPVGLHAPHALLLPDDAADLGAEAWAEAQAVRVGFQISHHLIAAGVAFGVCREAEVRQRRVAFVGVQLQRLVVSPPCAGEVQFALEQQAVHAAPLQAGGCGQSGRPRADDDDGPDGG